MADQVTIDNGVGTHQRVALDLMPSILVYDSATQQARPDKTTILNLYQDCLQATYGQWEPDR